MDVENTWNEVRRKIGTNHRKAYEMCVTISNGGDKRAKLSKVFRLLNTFEPLASCRLSVLRKYVCNKHDSHVMSVLVAAAGGGPLG